MDNKEIINDEVKSTVLFVDDEQNILTSLRRLFRKEGYNILLATSGKEGLSILENEHVDVVVSDMRMPEMDGAEFLGKAAQKWPDTVRILLTGFSDITSTVSAVNEGKIYKYISKPWEDSDIKISIRHALEGKFLKAERDKLLAITQQQNEQLKELNTSLEDKVKERTKELSNAMGLLETAHSSLKKNYMASVKVFSNLVEIREGSNAGHSPRVADLSRKLAVSLNIGETGTQDVLFAGLLHDIGKISLSDELLKKPFNALTSIEREEVVKHPVVGEAILMALEPLHGAAQLIKAHHERYDGRGFPDGLKGNEIPMGARILALVNDYDALQSGAMATQRYSMREAIEFIKQNSAKRYDPKVVEAFLAQVDTVIQKPVGRILKLSSNALRTGLVLAKDLVTKDGVMLLSTGHILDEKLIDKICNYERGTGSDLEIFVSMSK